MVTEDLVLGRATGRGSLHTCHGSAPGFNPGRQPARLFMVAALLTTLLTSHLCEAQVSRGFISTVTRVVDGDTIYVRIGGDRIEKVRYIGMDTPEVHHPTAGKQPGAHDAMEVNRRLVARQTVRLELDVQERDRYGRLLAYVYVGEMMVNAELVKQGYAPVMTVPPNVRYQDMFLKLQREAREARRGLWK
jgi:micrococcal nuclease